jgi:hypothetical protein
MTYSKHLGGTLNVTASGGSRIQQVQLEAGHVAAVTIDADTTGTDSITTVAITNGGVTGDFLKILAQNIPALGRPVQLQFAGVRARAGQTIQVTHLNSSGRAKTVGIVVHQQIDEPGVTA